MKIMKKHLRAVHTFDGRLLHIWNTLNCDLHEGRWWTKARIPGEVRASTLPGGSAHHPVKYGKRRRAINAGRMV